MAELAPSDRSAVAVAWRRVQAMSLLTIGVSLYAVLILTMELIPPVLIFGTLFTALSVLLWVMPTNRWVSIVTALVAVLAMAGNAPFLIEDISHPESWAGFIPGAMTILGVLSTVVACVMSFRAPSAETQRYWSSAAGLGVTLAVLSLVISFTTDSATAEASDVTVVAEGVHYPATLEASAGRIAFFVENHDLFRHTFVIEGQDVKEELPGSKNRRVEVELAPGEYRYICDVPGHERMEGILTVR